MQELLPASESTPQNDELAILMVEDDELDARLIKKQLCKGISQNVRLTCAGTLAEARAQLEAHEFEIIILDLCLPDGMGIEIVQQVRSINTDAAIVVLTGNDDLTNALEALRLGAQDYLIKHDLTADSLARGVRYSLQRHSLAKQLEQANAHLKLLKAEADAANDAKSRFLANMSHEIRSPLTAVLGFTGILLDEMEAMTAADIRDSLTTVQRHGKHLLTLTSDILDLAKIESGRLTLERVPTSLRDLLSDVLVATRVRAAEKQLAIEVKVAEQVPRRVLTDPTRLRQVLTNLIENAIKFTDSGCVHVEVNTAKSEDTIKFQVKDQGIGMTEAEIARIFMPFEQAKSSTTRNFGGTGLGLTICQRLVVGLGGRLVVVSSPRNGSTFTFDINAPATRDKVSLSQTDASRPSQAADRGSSTPRLVNCNHALLAEDSHDNGRLIEHLLLKAGVKRVTIARDGRQAIELCQQFGHEFDIVLMDMQMPTCDGYEASTVLREQGFTPPIIALTAHAMTGDREKCLQAGCDDYVQKPIDRAVLIERMAKWTERK